MLNLGRTLNIDKQFIKHDINGDMAIIMDAHSLSITLYYSQDGKLVDSYYGEVSAANLHMQKLNSIVRPK
tara:strand:- start:1310 stop:1519 length:210 start_codon:yes stop_codon:yes gene_type:complete